MAVMAVSQPVITGREDAREQNSASRADLVAPVLLVLAVPFMRPFLLGERYTPVGIGLVAMAVILSVFADRQQQKMSPALRSIASWLLALWAWEAILIVLHPGGGVTDFVKSIGGVLGVAIGSCIVLREQRRRDVVTRGVLILVVAGCVSYMATFVLWQVTGYGSLQVAALPVGYRQAGDIPFAFPFTPTSGAQSYGSLLIPRYLGLGREPGIMAALVVWAIFMLPRGRWRPAWTLTLIAGLAGTQSTAGFGVLIIVWVVTSFMVVPQQQLGSVLGVARQAAGLALLVAAFYLAIFAPTFGVVAKTQINPASVGDRQAGALAGWHAITEHPLGLSKADPTATGASGTINVIASTTLVGVPGLVLLLGGITAPLVLAERRREVTGAALVIIGTVLAAQPLLGSTGFYVLLAVAVSKAKNSGARICDEPEGR